MTIRFEDHQKTLETLAWTFTATCPSIPYEDFVSAGHEIFIRCLKKFKSGRACFNTYFHASLVRFFKGMVSQKAKEQKMFLGADIDSWTENSLNPERQTMFWDTILKTSEDARSIITEIFSAPELKLSLGEIRNRFRTVWHGDEVQNRISDAFKEIRQTLKEM